MVDQLVPYGDFKGTDLVPRSVGPERELESLDLMDEGDVVLPVITLVHGTTIDKYPGSKLGAFFNTVTQEVIVPPLRVLVVHQNASRALFPDLRKPEQKGLETCISSDAVTGSVYGSCAICEHAQWQEHEDGTRSKPLCSLSTNLAVLTPGGPALIRIRRGNSTNAKAVKAMLSAAKFDRKELWERFLLIGVVSVPRDAHTNYYAFSLRWQRDVEPPPEMCEAAKAMHGMLRAAYEAKRFRPGEVDEENGDGPAPQRHQDSVEEETVDYDKPPF